MWPCCETLARIRVFDYVLGIMKSEQPVESRAEGLVDESSTAGMVPTCSFVDITQ
jgi:hypothetical protein